MKLETVRLSEEASEQIRGIARQKGCSAEEAAAYVLNTYSGRYLSMIEKANKFVDSLERN